MQNVIDERSTAKDDEQKSFKPFVRHLGEHLNGYGQVCSCAKENNRAVPKVMSVTVQKKTTRIPTWDATERGQAQQNGIPVWVHSESREQRQGKD